MRSLLDPRNVDEGAAPFDHLTALEVAHAAQSDLNDRRENAKRAVTEFALRALLDGTDVYCVMDAVNFEATTRQDYYGDEVEGDRRSEFARLLASEVMQMVAPEATS